MLKMIPTEGKRLTGDPHSLHCLHTLDLGHVTNIVPIHMGHGYYQNYQFLKPHKDKIRNDWLRWRCPFVETDPEAVYVHCRRTDYVPGVDNPNRPTEHGVSTTIAEYRKCLEYFPDAKRLVVCTDDPNDLWLLEFHRLGLPWELSGGRWDTDFLLLASARWMIMTQSSYSWLAGFLGRCEKIVCPVFPGSHWHCGLTDIEKPQLYVDDEPERWHWVTK